MNPYDEKEKRILMDILTGGVHGTTTIKVKQGRPYDPPSQKVTTDRKATYDDLVRLSLEQLRAIRAGETVSIKKRSTYHVKLTQFKFKL